MLVTALIAPAAAASLSLLDPLVGHCWTTRLSPDLVDRHCFRLVYGGKHVRDEHVVLEKDRAVYSGETIFSEVPEGLAFLYVNSLGGAGHGTATTSGSGIRFRLTMRATPSADPQVIETSWTIGPQGFDMSTSEGIRHFRLDDR